MKFFINPADLERQIKEIIEVLRSGDVRQFLKDHENDDEKQLVLKQKNIGGIPSAIIAEQIAGRRKAKEKLPLYYQTPAIIYPPAINLEQSSSQRTAEYKRDIAAQLNLPEGEAIDLTGGFGTDTFFLSRLFPRIHYVEPDTSLLEIARHNHQQLGAGNIIYHNATAANFLDAFLHRAAFIFIDPSRRSETKKVYALKDSEPDVVQMQSKIFDKTNFLLVKASPMLDIQQGIKTLSSVKKAFVVAVENEVKELLFFCEKNFSGEPAIEAVNLAGAETQSLVFLFSEETSANLTGSDYDISLSPLIYLYEPNASILKGGAFKIITKRFDVAKMHPNTHLYTSGKLIADFPGRIFRIIAEAKPDAKILSRYFPEGKANIITRNYPLSADQLKKKTGLNDGGVGYLIAFTAMQKKIVLAASRLK